MTRQTSSPLELSEVVCLSGGLKINSFTELCEIDSVRGPSPSTRGNKQSMVLKIICSPVSTKVAQDNKGMINTGEPHKEKVVFSKSLGHGFLVALEDIYQGIIEDQDP